MTWTGVKLKKCIWGLFSLIQNGIEWLERAYKSGEWYQLSANIFTSCWKVFINWSVLADSPSASLIANADREDIFEAKEKMRWNSLTWRWRLFIFQPSVKPEKFSMQYKLRAKGHDNSQILVTYICKKKKRTFVELEVVKTSRSRLYVQ